MPERLASVYRGAPSNSRLSSRRWTLFDALIGASEARLRELARRLGRDVKRVHADARDRWS